MSTSLRLRDSGFAGFDGRNARTDQEFEVRRGELQAPVTSGLTRLNVVVASTRRALSLYHHHVLPSPPLLTISTFCPNHEVCDCISLRLLAVLISTPL